jgi:HEPN domain-containing protein
MNRSDFARLARIRLQEARALLEAGQFAGAYYLCGYAVECALKACIARQTRRYDFPDKNRVNKSYTHKLDDLVKLAGLEADRNCRAESDASFSASWTLVDRWSEDSRYDFPSEQDARDLYKATLNPKYGVLTWIRRHW